MSVNSCYYIISEGGCNKNILGATSKKKGWWGMSIPYLRVLDWNIVTKAKKKSPLVKIDKFHGSWHDS